MPTCSKAAPATTRSSPPGAIAPLRVDGGSGIDTFNGDGIADGSLDKLRYVHDIERIDLTGGNANVLVLDRPTVAAIVGLTGDPLRANTLVI